jgi:hypothetical protein
MSKKQRNSQAFPGRMSRIINAGLLRLDLRMWWKLGLDGQVISGVGIGGRGCWVLVSPSFSHPSAQDHLEDFRRKVEK